MIVSEYPVPDEPGTRFEYSNANSSLVARVIERATSRRYAAFIGSELMQPLGAAPGEVWINRPGGVAHSGCCLLTPAHTWLRLGLLLLRDGVWEGHRLLPEGFVREVRTPSAQNPHFGLGVFVAGPYRERRSWGNPATASRSLACCTASLTWPRISSSSTATPTRWFMSSRAKIW